MILDFLAQKEKREKQRQNINTEINARQKLLETWICT